MELFDVLDENGNFTGEVKSREKVHLEGDWHRTVHCWVLNEKRELLLQLRGPNQEANPNMWDTSCAGHISAGEDVGTSVERELEEELGVIASSASLIHLGTCKGEFKSGEVMDREFSEIFLLRDISKSYNFKLCEKEVSAVKWMAWSELREQIMLKRARYVDHPQEFQLLFQYLEQLA